MTTTRRMHGGRGFTLLEAIATITILAVVMGLASRVVFAAADSYSAAATRAELHGSLSVAMDRVCTSLREIGLRATSTTPLPDVNSVSTSAITWSTDYTLAVSGSSLLLTEDGGTPRALATDVSEFTLRVFDESNAVLTLPLSGTACDPIRRVEVTLTLTGNSASESLRSKVFLRCMMTGGAP